jgi:hypothetical protein
MPLDVTINLKILFPAPTTVTPPLSTVPFTVVTETDEKGGTFFEPPRCLRSLRHNIKVKMDSRFRIIELRCNFR